MASRRSSVFLHAKPNHVYPAPDPAVGDLFEFDEADLWTSGQALAAETRKMFPTSKKAPKRSAPAPEKTAKASSSLPVNVSGWSRILQSNRREMDGDFEEEEEEDGEIGRVPPHEYLARQRGESFSVHEGFGRTLKGRDLRRVRNDIWKKTGFED